MLTKVAQGSARRENKKSVPHFAVPISMTTFGPEISDHIRKARNLRSDLRGLDEPSETIENKVSKGNDVPVLRIKSRDRKYRAQSKYFCCRLVRQQTTASIPPRLSEQIAYTFLPKCLHRFLSKTFLAHCS